MKKVAPDKRYLFHYHLDISLLQTILQGFLPALVGLLVSLTVLCIRLNDLELVERSESLIAVLVDTGTDARTLGCTHGAIGIVEFDGGTADAGQRVAEQRRKEHIGLAGMNLLDVHTHLFHNLHTVAEGEDDALLSCTDDMSLRVLIEVQTVDRTADFLVLKHTLGTIAERNNVPLMHRSTPKRVWSSVWFT